MNITIKDESATGKLLNEITLSIQQQTITVAGLIRARVEQEVANFNERKANSHHTSAHSLVTPNSWEERLNSKKPIKFIDAEEQYYVAMEAFKNNGFFLLIENLQVTDPHAEIWLHEEMSVSFLKLTPLVGG